jgi:hypothetical protein
VKPTEYPEEDARAVPFSAADEEQRRATAEKPRYLDLPASPEDSRAQRNLALGVICFVMALVSLWLGLKYDRGAALQCLAASLGSFGLFWLLFHSQILRQRHGFFLGLSLVAVLGTLLPFFAAGLSKLDRMADERIAGASPESSARTVPPPVPTAATAPAAPSAPELSPDDLSPSPEPPGREVASVGKKTASAAVKSAPPVDDGIVRDFVAPPPDMKAGKIISIAEDCVVTIDGRKWRLKAGQLYRYKTVEDGIVTFSAGDQEVSIDTEYVKFTGQSLETPQKIEEMAKIEAANRYPALRQETSKENRLFNKSKIEMEADPGGDVFFSDPRWPVILADQLAAAHGWKRADLAEETTNVEEAAGPAAVEPSSSPQASPPTPEKAPAPADGKASAPGKPTPPPASERTEPAPETPPVVPPIIPPAPGRG